MKISCETVQDLLPLYEDSVLSAPSARLVKAHLAHCPHCRAYQKCIRDAFLKAEKPILPPREQNYLRIAQRMERQRAANFGFLAAAGMLCAFVVTLSVLLRKKG